MSRSRRTTACRVSGKRRFRDDAEAKQALHRATAARHFAADAGVPCHRRECRYYTCEHCHGVHLTSWAEPGVPPERTQGGSRDWRAAKQGPLVIGAWS
jgi:hypothetical protein